MSRHHRFYISPTDRELRHRLWIDDKSLVHQWVNVLRYKVGDELILFDGKQHERLYKILRFKPDSCQLQHVTDLQVKQPQRHVHLFWSLLKSDKNDWLLQKCSELGVSAFTPLITSRTIGKSFNDNRARKIIVEAAEQCGRIDIPRLHDVTDLKGSLTMHQDSGLELYFAHMEQSNQPVGLARDQSVGIYVGPEGGWNKADLKLFTSRKLTAINLGNFILRAETAAVVATSKFL